MKSRISKLLGRNYHCQTKLFLIYTAYCLPTSTSEWTDLFEKELSTAQTTGINIIVMGDFNINLQMHSNKKWLNLIKLFDLSQPVFEPTRVTGTSSTIIDHIYTSNLQIIAEYFVSTYSMSDHFLVCFIKKFNNKIAKVGYITTSYL